MGNIHCLHSCCPPKVCISCRHHGMALDGQGTSQDNDVTVKPYTPQSIVTQQAVTHLHSLLALSIGPEWKRYKKRTALSRTLVNSTL